MKLIVRSAVDNRVPWTKVKKVGDIDAEKDNYFTLKQTICPKLNESLNIIATKLLCFSSNKIYFGYRSDNTSILVAIKIKLVMTGDLEFYHTILG